MAVKGKEPLVQHHLNKLLKKTQILEKTSNNNINNKYF